MSKLYIKYPLSIAAILAFSLSLTVNSPVWSQPPPQPAVDQATRQIDRDVREKVEKEMVKPPKKEAPVEKAPEAVEFTGPKLFVKSITLVGVKSFPADNFKPIISKFENRDVYEQELQNVLVKEIEREYLRKGAIAACFIPPQEVKDGALTLRVVEAKMGNLESEKTRYFSKDRLNYYWSIKPGEVLNYEKISRSLQFMNKNPDRQVTATLHKGEKPETTDVLLNAKTFWPLHITALFDNEGSVPTGKTRTGFGFVENNITGHDDTLMAGYTGGKNFGGVYGYHRLPITNYGTSILYGYNETKAYPKKDFQQFELSSMANSASAFLYQDLFHKDEYKGELSFGVEAKNKRVVGINGTINTDRLRFLRASLALLGRDGKSVTYIKPQISQGLNWFGARRQSEFSSRNAQNTPTEFSLNINFIRTLVHNIKAQFKFSGLLASEKLMPQEELYMGGIDSVRGYPSGDYLADTGFYNQSELIIPAFFLPDWARLPYGERPIKDEINGVLFFDYGYGIKRGLMDGEISERRMGSLGAGVRVRLCNQANLRLEWGFPMNPLVNNPITEMDRSRLHFSIDIQERLPEEVERFSKEFKANPNPFKYYARKKERELAEQKATEIAQSAAESTAAVEKKAPESTQVPEAPKEKASRKESQIKPQKLAPKKAKHVQQTVNYTSKSRIDK
ncbi:MAG: BamA/TamA family outer membrane protein [Candidatus Omnitrophica bacterium]|nr:BamA/TamA family outer membrane protein [Candidatus Omnitrophota bacterium]